MDCPSCKQIFNNQKNQPLFLLCGHTVCKECLTAAHALSSKITCPIDYKQESRDISDLGINYALITCSEFPSTILAMREKCSFHDFPISMICRTCDSNCCSKCIRKHRAHDIYDIHHPALLQEIDEKLHLYELKISSSLDFAQNQQSILNNELSHLSKVQKDQEAKIEQYFDHLLKMLEEKKTENLGLLRSVFSDSFDKLIEIQKDTDDIVKEYSGYIFKLNQLKQEYYSNSFSDRAITSYNFLRKLEYVRFSETPDLINAPIRPVLDLSNLDTFDIPTVQFFEQSPLDALENEFKSSMNQLMEKYELYSRLSPEEKLGLEIGSAVFWIYLHADDEKVLKTYLIKDFCLKFLGQEAQSLPKTTLKLILPRFGLIRILKYNYQIYANTLKNTIIYSKGLIQAYQYIKNKNYEEAFSILHYFIIKWNSFTVAENAMNVLFFIVCSEGLDRTKHLLLSTANNLFKMVIYYLRFHVLPSSLIYKQVTGLLKFYRNQIYLKPNENNFGPIIRSLNKLIEDLSTPCEYNIESVLPDDIVQATTETDGINFLKWENEEVSRIFLEKSHEFNQDCVVWRNTLARIYNRGEVLTDSELLELEPFN